LVVVGKDPYVHNHLREQFETRKLAKEYHTLVVGSYPDSGAIDIPIGEGHDLRSSLDHKTLKKSRTGIEVLRKFSGYTLLSCVPKTGRQNQIRLHLAAVGFPIVGDERLGSNRPPADFPQRYLLHSRWLRFYHPRLKVWLELTAPLPQDFEDVVKALDEKG
jgi:23S rRNA pseudouridine1911/1915/1917 synthase